MSDQAPEAPEAPTPPTITRGEGRSVGFVFCGLDVVGQLPPTLTCITLRRVRTDAYGWTAEAVEAQQAENARANEENRPARVLLDGSAIDQHAVGALRAACVALCWPDGGGKPSLRDYRHDVVAYGAAALDWLLAIHPGQAGQVLQDVREVGQALYDASQAAYTAIFEKAAVQAVFTETSPGATG